MFFVSCVVKYILEVQNVPLECDGNYFTSECVSCRLSKLHLPIKDHYVFHASVIVLVYMVARFLLFSNAHSTQWILSNAGPLRSCLFSCQFSSIPDRHIVATWSERGKVHIWDTSQQVISVDNPTTAAGASHLKDVKPLYTFDGHQVSQLTKANLILIALKFRIISLSILLFLKVHSNRAGWVTTVGLSEPSSASLPRLIINYFYLLTARSSQLHVLACSAGIF